MDQRLITHLISARAEERRGTREKEQRIERAEGRKSRGEERNRRERAEDRKSRGEEEQGERRDLGAGAHLRLSRPRPRQDCQLACLAAPPAAPGCLSHWLLWSGSDGRDVVVRISAVNPIMFDIIRAALMSLSAFQEAKVWSLNPSHYATICAQQHVMNMFFFLIIEHCWQKHTKFKTVKVLFYFKHAVELPTVVFFYLFFYNL